MCWGLREGQVSISQTERLAIIKRNKQGLSLGGKKPSSTILSWKAGVLYQIVWLDLFRRRISSPVKTIHFLWRKQCGLLLEHDDWVVRKQSNAYIFITEKSNSENLKPDPPANFKTHLTDKTGVLSLMLSDCSPILSPQGPASSPRVHSSSIPNLKDPSSTQPATTATRLWPWVKQHLPSYRPAAVRPEVPSRATARYVF